MYDLQQLENDWRRYRRKKYLKYGAMTLGALAVAGAVLVAPSFWGGLGDGDGFALGDDLQKPSAHQDASSREQTASKHPKPKKSGWKMTFADAGDPETSPASSSPAKHVDIRVQSQKVTHTVADIAKRFRRTHDKDDAVFLARYYSDKKQYKKALNWALEANKLDSNIEESWLIFARAKAKLGQRMEAIRVLQAYCDRSRSAKAKKLLDRIRRGAAF